MKKRYLTIDEIKNIESKRVNIFDDEKKAKKELEKLIKASNAKPPKQKVEESKEVKGCVKFKIDPRSKALINFHYSNKHIFNSIEFGGINNTKEVIITDKSYIDISKIIDPEYSDKTMIAERYAFIRDYLEKKKDFTIHLSFKNIYVIGIPVIDDFLKDIFSISESKIATYEKKCGSVEIGIRLKWEEKKKAYRLYLHYYTLD